MLTTYVIILAITGWLGGFMLSLFATRLFTMMGREGPAPAILIALIITLCLLVVAAAPAALVIACVLLIIASFLNARDLPPIAGWGLPLVIALVAMSGISAATPPPVPVILISAVALLLFYVALSVAARLPADTTASHVILWPLVPLIAAPFLGGPSYITLDIVLIATPLMGALMIAPHATFQRTLPAYMLIVSWLIVETAAHGGWIVAAVALGALVAATLRTLQSRSPGLPHAL